MNEKDENLSKLEERRRCVERLVMVQGLNVSVVAEILGTSRHTVQNDMRSIKERWASKAVCTSEAAIPAHEEIEGILSIARDLLAEANLTQKIADKVALSQASAHCFFLAGRLKQGLGQ